MIGMADIPVEPSILSPDTLRPSGAMLSAQIALGRLIEKSAVAPTGYAPTLIDLLVRLDQASGNQLRAVDLSRQLLLSPSHVSRMIDRAEAAGLVRRNADPNDRRATLVTLTHLGRAVLVDFAPRLEAVIERVIHLNLLPAETETLVELLGRIERAAVKQIEGFANGIEHLAGAVVRSP